MRPNHFAYDPNKIGTLFQVLRERQAAVGTIVVPRQIQCPCCKGFKPAHKMGRITSTGLVVGVMDCLCPACHAEHGVEFSRLTRVVCAGCREVVAVVSPGKEKNGFVWVSGGFVHVANCPACSGNSGLKESPIAEKVAFFKARGLPYRP